MTAPETGVEAAAAGADAPVRLTPAARLRLGWSAFRDALRLGGFAASILWGASPFLALGFLGLGIISGFVPLLQAWATQGLLGAVTHHSRGRPPAFSLHEPYAPWFLILLGALFAVNLIESVTPLMAAYLNERVGETLGRQILRKATRVPLAALENSEFHLQLERLRSLTGEQFVGRITAARQFLSAILGMLGIALFIGRSGWLLALLLLATAAPIVLLALRQEQEFVRINYEQTPLKRRLAYWRELSTTRGPAAELRLFRLGPFFLDRWRDLRDLVRQELFSVRVRQLRSRVAYLLFTSLVSGGVVIGLVYASARGMLPVGGLVAALYALGQFANLRTGIPYQIQALRMGVTQFRFLKGFLEREEEPQHGLPAPGPLRYGIVFEGVSFTYPGSERAALTDVNLTLRPGERLALLGRNGAGKSTLALLLLGLHRPTSGRILVDGLDLAEIDPAAWRERAAAVFQNFVRYQFTARENIALGAVAHPDNPDRIEAAAARSGADPFIRRLARGYDTPLGRGFTGAQELSGGQWQKIAIARAYLRDAELLVLDEPAASVDALAELEIYRQFSEVSRSRTVLLISHRLGCARLADRILFLENGRVVEQGSHEALLAANGPYAELFRLQAEWYRSGSLPGERRDALPTAKESLSSAA